eukprot:144688_1
MFSREQKSRVAIFQDSFETPEKHGQVLKKSKISASGKRVNFHKAVSLPVSPLPHKATKSGKKHRRHVLGEISNTPYNPVQLTGNGKKNVNLSKKPKLSFRSPAKSNDIGLRGVKHDPKLDGLKVTDNLNIPDDVEYTHPYSEQNPEPGSMSSPLCEDIPRILAPNVPPTVERKTLKLATKEDEQLLSSKEYPFSPYVCALTDDVPSLPTDVRALDDLDRSFSHVDFDLEEEEEDDGDCSEVELAYPLPGMTPPPALDEEEDDPLADPALQHIASTILAPSVGCVTPLGARGGSRLGDSNYEELLDLYGENLAFATCESPNSSFEISDIELTPFCISDFEIEVKEDVY